MAMVATCNTSSTSRERLIREHIRLAKYLARDLARRMPSSLGDPFDIHDEARSDAFVGLVLAARDFDPSQGVPFGMYAGMLIRREIIDGHRRRLHLRKVRRNMGRVKDATDRLSQQLGRTPRQDELLAEVGMTADELHEVRRKYFIVTCPRDIDEPLPGLEDELFMGDRLPDPEPLALDRLVAKDEQDELRTALDVLPVRQRQVVHLYYWEGCTLIQIGETLGITEAGACYLMARAREKLKAALSEPSA